MRTILLFASLMAGCVPVTETDLSDQGTACVDDGTILVDFGTCLSSSCDTLENASCTATLEGDVVVVSSTATVVSQGNECTADCGFAQTTCELPEGAEEAVTLRYGGADVAIAEGCEPF